jgi:hypothetical protein
VQKINQKALIATPFPRGVPKKLQASWVDYLDKMFDGADQLERMAREQNGIAADTRRSILSSVFRRKLS